MLTERSISRRNMLFGPVRSHGDPVVQVAEHCLSLSGIACRACEDACAVRAIRFEPRLGGVDRLSIDIGTCSGCGECLPVCPVSALSLDGRRGHD